MKDHFINSDTKSLIGGWYSDQLQVCDDIISNFHDKRNNIGTDNNPILTDRTKKYNGYNSMSSLDIGNDIMSQYLNKILKPTLHLYKQQYPYCSDKILEWKLDYDFNIQHYPPNYSYSVWHCENNGEFNTSKTRRHLVFMTYLNTIAVDGYTSFYHQGVNIKPEKGLTLIWPAHWTHMHKGIPAPNEDKYIITGWYCFVTPRNISEFL